MGNQRSGIYLSLGYQIMMLTDTIYLEILAIEEETLTCIKLHIAETGS